ncbi:MAG: serine--tRNA ligase [Patescibacteria group bacterium]|nr:serine--tRNA ligase [Patescibacteria group bacterium]MBU1877267.1 serine--tRNA ligase [Patescibacteria group bacterium]
MLDIKFIRQNPDKVKEGCQKKQIEVDIDNLLILDEKKRGIIRELELLRAEQNKISNQVRQEKDESKKSTLIITSRELGPKIKEFEENFKAITQEVDKLMLQIPNLPFDNVPVGKDDSESKVLREVGKKPKFNFAFKDYLTLAEDFDLIDIKRAAKTSGSRFGFLKGEAVLLEFALIKFAFDILIKKGFIPILPPVMLKEEMALGTGYLEASDKEEAYFIPGDNFYLIGTSEQSMLAMHADESFEEKDLPKKYCGFSTCFRREAGSYGKDTKGILRVHQFDKIEMISFSRPEDSTKELQSFLGIEEKLMQALKIPYRVIQICTGDLGRPAAEKYDIEAWIPSENRYRETHSTSNCTDFQARRLNIKYKSKTGLNYVYTLNGTAFAIGRTLIAIIENYQQKDGSIVIPKVLQKYMGIKKIIKKK